jgi:hypothetical protein
MMAVGKIGILRAAIQALARRYLMPLLLARLRPITP